MVTHISLLTLLCVTLDDRTKGVGLHNAATLRVRPRWQPFH